MKHYLALFLALLICLFALAGCSQQQDRSAALEVTYRDILSGDTSTHQLTEAERTKLLNILNECQWKDSLWDCVCDCQFTVNSDQLSYDSSSGCINDTPNRRCTVLNEEDRVWFNSVLGINN